MRKGVSSSRELVRERVCRQVVLQGIAEESIRSVTYSGRGPDGYVQKDVLPQYANWFG